MSLLGFIFLVSVCVKGRRNCWFRRLAPLRDVEARPAMNDELSRKQEDKDSINITIAVIFEVHSVVLCPAVVTLSFCHIQLVLVLLLMNEYVWTKGKAKKWQR